jgi:hypothetical protein
MLRTFFSLALCCVFSSLGIAQQVQIRPNPVRAETSATWEYGLLIYVAVPNGSAIGPVWLSADTTLFRALDSAATQPNPAGRAGPTSLIRRMGTGECAELP